MYIIIYSYFYLLFKNLNDKFMSLLKDRCINYYNYTYQTAT